MKISTLFPNGSTMKELSNLNAKEISAINSYIDSGLLHYESYHHRDFVIERETFIMEDFITSKVLSMVKRTGITEEQILPLIKEYEELNHISLSDEQKEGIVTLLIYKVAILTGGPGTGKTSALNCLLYCIRRLDANLFRPGYVPYSLFSPTGKAARRIEESTGAHASTILKGIGYNPFTNKIRIPIYKKYLIIDEFSMVDLPTFYKMLLAMKNGDTRLSLIGDENQLPSVGCGSLLRDLIHSGVIPSCSLVKTFRQKENSVLFRNILLVKKGLHVPFEEGDDFEYHEDFSLFFDMYFKAIEEVGIDKIVVLTPTRKVGQYCSNNINDYIQRRYNQNSGITTEVFRDGKKRTITFKVGDPVIQLENREVANGDIGKIVSVDEQKSEIYVQFTNVTLRYFKRELNQLDLAYAISIHKAQGAEFPIVFLLCTKEGLLDKNMVYTAITRAKKKCIVFGNLGRIMKACKKESTWDRITTVPYMLEEKICNKICKEDLGL